MKMFRFVVLAILFAASPAVAQWQTPSHSVPIGQGAGVTGFGSAAPSTAGLPLISTGPTSDPVFGALPSVGIQSGVVDNSKFPNAPADTAKCNPAGSSGPVQDCTSSQLASILSLTVRTRFTGNTTFYLSPAGNDANNGTSPSTPKLSCGNLIFTLRQNYDFNGFNAVVQFLNGVYTAASLPCVVAGTFTGADNAGQGAIVFQGDTTQTASPPNNVTLTSNTSVCFQVQSGVQITIQFVWLRCVIGGEAVYGGFLSVNNVIEDTAPIGSGSEHFLAQEGGIIELNGPMYLFASVGAAPDALYESKHIGHLRLINGPFTLISGLTVNVATGYNEDLGDITVTGTMESTGFAMGGFNITGKCFQINANAVTQWQGGTGTCSTNAAPTLQFPGSSPGSVSLGGVLFN